MRLKFECVKYFIELLFGDSYSVEFEELKVICVVGFGVVENDELVMFEGMMEVVLSDSMVVNGIVLFESICEVI